jgi:hypothetical protein
LERVLPFGLGVELDAPRRRGRVFERVADPLLAGDARQRRDDGLSFVWVLLLICV